MHGNNLEYKVNHFLVLVGETPAGELLVDYGREEYIPLSYKTVLAPLVNYWGLESKTSESLKEYIDYRAVPKARVNCMEILNNWGLSVWDAFDQFYVTRGRHCGDPQTVKFVGEDITLEEVLAIRSEFNSGVISERFESFLCE